MIDTDLLNAKSELEEVARMFDGGEEMNIRHRFSHTYNKFVNTVTVNGQTFAYGNLVGEIKDKTEEKRLVKRYAKLSLYKALSLSTGVTLPWGALTGIRPTKLAYRELEEGRDFREFFTEVMKVSEDKTALTADVIDTQKGIYVKDDDNTDLFVFVPFCPTRCRYCSFISADMRTAAKYVDEYTDALVKEIERSKRLIRKLRSIYIGGGTPVALDDAHLEKILCALDNINTGVEFTVEAGRPDRITKENLDLFRSHGVTRICINPQTFNDATLERIGRNHTSLQTIEKYYMAKDKFSVNMDLIAGLDGERAEDFARSLDKAIELSPDNITVHTLCIKRGSYLAESEKRLSGAEAEKMIEYAHRALKEGGYSPYYLYRQKYMAGNLENVGYTKRGKACVYNIDVMEEISQNVACGANAVSKRIYSGGERIERYGSPKDVPTYIKKIGVIMEEKEKLFF